MEYIENTVFKESFNDSILVSSGIRKFCSCKFKGICYCSNAITFTIREKEDAFHEFKVLKILHSYTNKVPKPLGLAERNGKGIVITEYIPGITLLEYIKSSSWDEIKRMLRKILVLLNSIDSRCKFTHYDLTVGNILIMQAEKCESGFAIMDSNRSQIKLDGSCNSIKEDEPYLMNFSKSYIEGLDTVTNINLHQVSNGLITNAYDPLSDLIMLLAIFSRISIKKDEIESYIKECGFTPRSKAGTYDNGIERLYAREWVYKYYQDMEKVGLFLERFRNKNLYMSVDNVNIKDEVYYFSLELIKIKEKAISCRRNSIENVRIKFLEFLTAY